MSFLTGIQQGSGLAPSTQASQAVICQVMLCNLALLVYVWRVKPYRSNFSNTMEKVRGSCRGGGR